MKKMSGRKTSEKINQTNLRPEYRFDYKKARPNRFAGEQARSGSRIVDPDVSAVFKTPSLLTRRSGR